MSTAPKKTSTPDRISPSAEDGVKKRGRPKKSETTLSATEAKINKIKQKLQVPVLTSYLMDNDVLVIRSGLRCPYARSYKNRLLIKYHFLINYKKMQ